MGCGFLRYLHPPGIADIITCPASSYFKLSLSLFPLWVYAALVTGSPDSSADNADPRVMPASDSASGCQWPRPTLSTPLGGYPMTEEPKPRPSGSTPPHA